MRLTLLVVSVLCCVAVPIRAAERPPTVVWFEKSLTDTSDVLANLCVDRSAAVVEQDDRHVVCQKEVRGLRGALAQALIGNSYSTSPVLIIRFSILRDGPFARVQASQWLETQMAFGQVRKAELNSAKQSSELMSVLLSTGAHNVRPEVPRASADPAVPTVTPEVPPKAEPDQP